MDFVKDKKLLKKLGVRIRQLRKERKLTQVQLAVLCNSYAEHLGRIERGELNVTISTLSIIAKSLSVTLPQLVDLE